MATWHQRLGWKGPQYLGRPSTFQAAYQDYISRGSTLAKSQLQTDQIPESVSLTVNSPGDSSDVLPQGRFIEVESISGLQLSNESASSTENAEYYQEVEKKKNTMKHFLPPASNGRASIIFEAAQSPPCEYQWIYLDDCGETQGPYTSSKLLEWLTNGQFDGRANILIRKDCEKLFRPLIDQLSSIITGASEDLRARLLKKMEVLEGDAEAATLSEVSLPGIDLMRDFEAIIPDPQKVIAEYNAIKHYEGTDMDLYIHQKSLTTEEEMAYVEVLKVPVHSGFLKLASPVWMEDISHVEKKFFRLLRYVDADKEIPRLKYNLQTDFPQAIRSILRFVYGVKLDAQACDPRLLVGIYKEALRFKISAIIEDIHNILARPLDLHTLVEFSSAAEDMSQWELLEDSIRLLVDSAFAILSDGLHLRLGPEGLIKLISSSNLQLDEIQIFQCAEQWMLHQTYSSSINYASFEKSIYGAIRFCAMSPTQIKDIRNKSLNCLLLDACLRKFFTEELKGRAFPWEVAKDFSLSFYGGRYPLNLKKSGGGMGRNYIPDWASTTGSKRLANQPFWAIEITQSKSGRLRIGAATETSNSYNAMTMYFDTEVQNFFTGEYSKHGRISPSRIIHYNSRIIWNRKIRKGDVILLQLTATATTVSMSIKVLDADNMYASYVFPYYGAVHSFGKIIQRPFLTFQPYYELIDPGDELGLPVLQAVSSPKN